MNRQGTATVATRATWYGRFVFVRSTWRRSHDFGGEWIASNTRGFHSEADAFTSLGVRPRQSASSYLLALGRPPSFEIAEECELAAKGYM